MVTKAIFQSAFIIQRVEICDKMLLLFSKILPALSTAWSLWSGSTCTGWEKSLQKIRRTVTSLLFLTESGPDELWKQNCLPHVRNADFSTSIEENEWKAYHGQVRRHGRRMNTERSKGRIINRDWWRSPASRAEGSNWNVNLRQKQELKCGQATAWQFSSRSTFLIPL